MTIRLIVGLANPGVKYAATRHNVGSWYINLLAEKLNSPLYEEPEFYGWTSCVNVLSVNVRLLIPTTFINLSGESVYAISNFYKINSNEIIVAHDELDLPPGVAKFKLNSEHIGHNGIKNIIDRLGINSKFYCLRIGIGRPSNKNKVVSFLLEEPSVDERKLIFKAINKAVHCTTMLFKEGLIRATNHLNAFKALR